MSAHRVIDFSIDEDNRGRLVASIERYPAWVVEVDALLTGGSPALAELRIYPRQLYVCDESDSFAWSPGSTPAAIPQDEKRARPAEDGWSGDSADVSTAGLPARLLRAVNAGELLDLAQRCAVDERDRLSHTPKLSARHWRANLAIRLERKTVTPAALSTGEQRRAGRHGNGIDHYLRWACRYAELVRSGDRRPIATLAVETNESRTYVAGTITDARRRHGLLTTAGQGRAGGALTEKALRLLDEQARKSGGKGGDT